MYQGRRPVASTGPWIVSPWPDAGASCSNSGRASIGVMAEHAFWLTILKEKPFITCAPLRWVRFTITGKWIDATTIDFEPLAAGMMGQPITENSGYFPDATTIEKTSEVKLGDGSVMRFEFKGKRVKVLKID